MPPDHRATFTITVNIRKLWPCFVWRMPLLPVGLGLFRWQFGIAGKQYHNYFAVCYLWGRWFWLTNS